MRFALALILAFIAPHVSFATDEWTSAAKLEAEAVYKAAKAKATAPEDIAALAELPHCTRTGNEWIGAWQLQRAAWTAHTDDDGPIALKYAHAVINHAGALKETKAKALTIISHYLAVDGKLAEALTGYKDALELDQNLASAKTGKANVEKAIAAKG